jgi:hypothetical protein
MTSQVLVELVGVIVMWWSTALLYRMYMGRVAQLEGRKVDASASQTEPAVPSPDAAPAPA